MIRLPKLPFARDALVPYISEQTIDFHYGKHHRSYVNNLNKLVKGTEFESKDLEEIVRSASGPIFNNAAQVWNHTFYWNGLASGSDPDDLDKQLRDVIKNAFGSLAELKKQLKAEAGKLFGSGWIWLVYSRGDLTLKSTHNADTPMKAEHPALLVVDVWEHAYYLDYQNERGKYVDAIWNVVNWKEVSKRYQETKR